jgi:predicted nucleic acid-binding protein
VTVPVLDTTALVDADRRGAAVAKVVESRHEAGDDAVVPIQAAIEYCAGRDDPAAGLRALRASFAIVPCDEEIGLEAARLARAALEAGRFPGWADVQIAATAKRLGMAVVTRDARHFEALGIEVLTYER